MNNEWGAGESSNTFTGDPPGISRPAPDQRIEVGSPTTWFGGVLVHIWKAIALGLSILILMVVICAVAGFGLGIASGIGGAL